MEVEIIKQYEIMRGKATVAFDKFSNMYLRCNGCKEECPRTDMKFINNTKVQYFTCPICKVIYPVR